MVEFPAQFADVIDTERSARNAGDLDRLSRQPAEGCVREVGVREFRKQIPRSRARDDQVPPVVGDVRDLDPFAFGHRTGQRVEILHLPRGAGEDVEAVLCDAGDRGLGLDASGLAE